MANTERCIFRKPNGACFNWTEKAGNYLCPEHQDEKCTVCGKQAQAQCNRVLNGGNTCQVVFCNAHEFEHKKGHDETL